MTKPMREKLETILTLIKQKRPAEIQPYVDEVLSLKVAGLLEQKKKEFLGS